MRLRYTTKRRTEQSRRDTYGVIINRKKIDVCVDKQQATCDTCPRSRNGLADRAEPGTGEQKMKTATQPRLTKAQRSKVERALEQHDRHKNSYFWTPNGGASGRRSTERKETWSVSFRHGGHEYCYSSDVNCSCKNYYYNGSFCVDGEQKTRRAFANLLPKIKA